MTADLEMVTWLRKTIKARMFLAQHTIELGNAATWTELSSGVLMTIAPDASQDRWDGVHPLGDSSLTRLMEANDPQDTIARCEAELAILDEHAPLETEWGGHRDDGTWQQGGFVCGSCGHDDGRLGVAWPCRTVRLLAAGYRYRDGYQASWAP
jgi:hypothetical protein